MTRTLESPPSCRGRASALAAAAVSALVSAVMSALVLGAAPAAADPAASPRLPDGAAARSSYWRERTSLFRALGGHADVVMLGDSLTDGAEWRELFPDQLIVNRGIDGDTADGVRARLDDVLALAPVAVFLMVGINDFTDSARSVDAVFDDVRAIVERLRARGVRVVLQSTLPCHEGLGAWKSCAAAGPAVRALNARLAGLASDRVAWVDLASRLAGEAGLRPEYTYDGVHLNGDGYRVWRDAIAALMPAGLLRSRPAR